MSVSREHLIDYSTVHVLQRGPPQAAATSGLHYERISFHGFQRGIFIRCCQSPVTVSVVMQRIELEVLGLDR